MQKFQVSELSLFFPRRDTTKEHNNKRASSSRVSNSLGELLGVASNVKHTKESFLYFRRDLFCGSKAIRMDVLYIDLSLKKQEKCHSTNLKWRWLLHDYVDK